MKVRKNETWTAKLDICPYCGCELNIKSLSKVSAREAVKGMLELANGHINNCKKIKVKRKTNFLIKNDYNTINTKCVSFNKQKMIM